MDVEDFKTRISSDLEYEGMVIDILYKNDQVAKLSCDKGIEKALIEIFHPDEEKSVWQLEYSSFEKVLKEGFGRLKEVNEIED